MYNPNKDNAKFSCTTFPISNHMYLENGCTSGDLKITVYVTKGLPAIYLSPQQVEEMVRLLQLYLRTGSLVEKPDPATQLQNLRKAAEDVLCVIKGDFKSYQQTIQAVERLKQVIEETKESS